MTAIHVCIVLHPSVTLWLLPPAHPLQVMTVEQQQGAEYIKMMQSDVVR